MFNIVVTVNITNWFAVDVGFVVVLFCVLFLSCCFFSGVYGHMFISRSNQRTV